MPISEIHRRVNQRRSEEIPFDARQSRDECQRCDDGKEGRERCLKEIGVQPRHIRREQLNSALRRMRVPPRGAMKSQPMRASPQCLVAKSLRNAGGVDVHPHHERHRYRQPQCGRENCTDGHSVIPCPPHQPRAGGNAERHGIERTNGKRTTGGNAHHTGPRPANGVRCGRSIRDVPECENGNQDPHEHGAMAHVRGKLKYRKGRQAKHDRAQRSRARPMRRQHTAKEFCKDPDGHSAAQRSSEPRGAGQHAEHEHHRPARRKL